MFIQPDWWEVTRAGVGTNRYAYAGNDPVNSLDPNGNFGLFGAIVGAIVGGLTQLAVDLADGRLDSSGSDYGGAIAGGAFVGATGGLAGGSILGLAAIGAAGGAVAEMSRQVSAGEHLDGGSIVLSAMLGGTLSFPGGSFIGRKAALLGTNTISRATKGKIGEQVTKRQYGAYGYFSKGNKTIPTGTKTATGRDAFAQVDNDMSLFGSGLRSFGVEAKFNTARLTANQRLAMGVEAFAVNRVSLSYGAALSGRMDGLIGLTGGTALGFSLSTAAPLRITIDDDCNSAGNCQ